MYRLAHEVPVWPYRDCHPTTTVGCKSSRMNECPSVLIVEDQQPTLERLAAAIGDNPLLQLAGTAANATDGEKLLRDLQPDVLLTDLDLPDGNGIDLIRIAANMDTTESMVITVFGDEKHVVNAIRAGATGYLLKDCDAVSIGEALLQLRDGGSPISPPIARYLLKIFQNENTAAAVEYAQKDAPAAEIVSPLTKREHEVLRLIAKGYSYQEIAESLHLSIHTVTSHIKHIYRKLAVGSRGEAVYEASQQGLL